MSRGSACLWTPLPQGAPSPCGRYKHACCTYQGDVYLMGGRNTDRLRDIWKYSVVRNEWTQLVCESETAPEELEEHSMVAHKGFLYVFGGTLDCVYTDWRCPLWVFDIGKRKWVHWQGKDSFSRMPTNRKSHSAVVLGSAMFLYGGFLDMRGSSQEFWRLDFDSMCWSLLGTGRQASGGPGPRHSHCAVAHGECMYMFGGLRGLREQRDFWSWNSVCRAWSCLRTSSGPPRLVGHAAVAYQDGMLLYGGGQSQGTPVNCLWRYGFASRSWERLAALPASADGPPPRIQHCCVGLGQGYDQGTGGAPVPGSHCPPAAAGGAGLKPRPFKNRCFPTGGTEGAIELQTFNADTTDVSERLVGEKKKSCLTFENRAFSVRWSCEEGDLEEEGIAQNLPDLLLVLGGKPLDRQAPISVWQMTLTES